MAIATFTRAGAAGVALAPRQRRFVHLYLLILLLAFSPLKAVALVLPLLFIAGLLFYVGTRARHNLRNLSLVAIFYVLLGALQLLAAPQFSPLTYALFAVTASSFLVFFMDLRPFADAHTIRSLRQVTLVVLTVEALFGLLQGAVSAARHGTFDGGVGDAVAGTIYLEFDGTSTL
ncbi:MAG TPA: hypothetical protein VNK95_01415, partial [Caldilineaceae bacterium]|nr:hypothetical protein [Caldilineaceae bacterium]